MSCQRTVVEMVMRLCLLGFLVWFFITNCHFMLDLIVSSLSRSVLVHKKLIEQAVTHLLPYLWLCSGPGWDSDQSGLVESVHANGSEIGTV